MCRLKELCCFGSITPGNRPNVQQSWPFAKTVGGFESDITFWLEPRIVMPDLNKVTINSHFSSSVFAYCRERSENMPFLCNGDFSVHSKTINGVQYVTFSFFQGESTIFDKVGNLITHSCEATEEVEIPSESLVDNGIAIKRD